jgi:hypothetical protein
MCTFDSSSFTFDLMDTLVLGHVMDPRNCQIVISWKSRGAFGVTENVQLQLISFELQCSIFMQSSVVSTYADSKDMIWIYCGLDASGMSDI